MEGRTPQERIEDFIINTPSYLEGVDVNETLILYTILYFKLSIVILEVTLMP